MPAIFKGIALSFRGRFKTVSQPDEARPPRIRFPATRHCRPGRRRGAVHVNLPLILPPSGEDQREAAAAPRINVVVIRDGDARKEEIDRQVDG